MSPPATAPDADHEKAASQLARRIERDIIAAGWPVGARLGSEPELIERYGTSRAVLREAIRLLEHHQIARTREGRNGGLVVTAPDSAAVVRALEVELEYRGVSLVDLVNVKRALELAAIPWVIDRLDADGEERLRRALAREREHGADPFDITDDNIHIALAELTGNPALQLIVKALTRLSAVLVQTQRPNPDDQHAYDDHGAIAEAILRRDADGAGVLLASHFDEIARALDRPSAPRPSRSRGTSARSKR